MFEQLFQYDWDSNLKNIDLLEKVDPSNAAPALRLVSHILNAQHIWLSRIAGTVPQWGVWQEHDLVECRDLLQGNFHLIRTLLADVDLAQAVTYQNSLGETFTNSIGDILFHLINHGTYHRAQVATQIRSMGLEPISTDYIFYKRKKS